MSAALPALRLATAADVPALAALYAEAAQTLGPLVYSPAQVAAWASFGVDTPAFRDYILSADTWIAGLPPVAFCGIDVQGEVHSLYVAPGLTRQGLGTQLLAHALAHARARGVQRFSAWATPFSRPVFERAGLHLVQTVTEPYQGVLFERYRLASA
ncbi:MAG: GNAT family N-acetyltransferase [Rubrivivax sp.]|nr:GNAT family N-acetyltransferase [Rubrivivax sp.]